MRWCNQIIEGYRTRPDDVRPEFQKGASPEQIATLESEIGCILPSALREFLQETNGVRESMFHGGEWFAISTPVWSCEEIAAESKRIRSDPDGPTPPADDAVTPLFISDPGVDGILFALFVRREGPEDPAVYGYHPIERAWTQISPSLEEHLRGWTIC